MCTVTVSDVIFFGWQTKTLLVWLIASTVSLPHYLSVSFPRIIPSSEQQTEFYANTKSHNALYCLVLTFEYLNGVFLDLDIPVSISIYGT